jgi:ubiquinone/menaquinone biosynthesis C-methylase UbiE
MNYKYLLKLDELILPLPILQKSLDFIPNKSNLKLLEVGAGSGKKTIPIAKEFQEIYIIEPEKYLIDKFEELCIKYKCNNIILINITFNDYIDNLKNYNKKFDVILFQYAIHFLDMKTILDKSKSIINPNGYVIIIHPKAIPKNWANPVLNKDSDKFDKKIWSKHKKHLIKYKKLIINSEYFIKKYSGPIARSFILSF